MQRHSKNILFILCFFVLVVNACRPESKGQATLTIPPDTTLDQIADSSGFLGQDGLDYEPLNTGTFDQLPAELTAILNTKYPGWSLPNISKEYLTKNRRNPTGPYYLQADFNGDKAEDFAVQYFFKDTIYIKAYLQQPNKKLQEYALGQFMFKRMAPKEESKLFLSLLSQGNEILTGTVPEKVILPQPAIAVSNNPEGFLYFYEKGRFKLLRGLPAPEI